MVLLESYFPEHTMGYVMLLFPEDRIIYVIDRLNKVISLIIRSQQTLWFGSIAAKIREMIFL